jgi:diguanylate cyclase (GGDEF)-like protein/PAS domain S-box-containing protein
LRTLLKGVNAELHEAENGFDALSLALEEDYALILLDVQMPEMDGFEVCEQLRADSRTVDTPVIFLTAAYKEQVDKVRGYVAGATDYLAKPIEDHILKAKVEVFLKLYEQRRQLQENNESLRIAATVFESQEGMLVTDLNNVIIKVNQAYTRITGYTPDQVIGKNPSIVSSGRQSAQFYADMWEMLKRDRYWQGEMWNRRKSGEIYPCWLTISAVLDAKECVTNYVGSFSDITTYKQAEDKIHHLAFYDPLTGLPNRRLLLDRARHALASCARNQRYGALMFLDLDNFKTLNDTKGHDFGDNLLIDVAHRLSEGVRQEDTVSRLGGDEFVVLLGDLDNDEQEAVARAQAIAEKLLNRLAEPYRLSVPKLNGADEIEYRCTSSIGITMFQIQDDSVEELLKRADVAMYQAKAAGRNAVRFFDPAMQRMIQNRSELEAMLNKSIPNKELELYYQMQVDANETPVGVEVLLRWNHPERGLVSPAEFIPLAEDNGYIVQMGLWVLETACLQLKRWESASKFERVKLSVNVSARQFRQVDFVDRVASVLHLAAIDPSRLVLELTESVVLKDVKEAILKMRALKELGVGLSMDDFGTGYSSLSYLQRLPLDEIKIDQSFVRDLIGNADNESIVKTIIVLAQELKMETVAEGVETREQFELLKSRGCTSFQGYLFSKPLPLDAFERMVEQQTLVPSHRLRDSEIPDGASRRV